MTDEPKKDEPRKGETIDVTTDIHKVVRERYAGFAQAGLSCCGPAGGASAAAPGSTEGAAAASGGSCGCGSQSVSLGGPSLAELGYTAEQAAAIPEGADLGLGCGNPLAYAAVKPGETVLDLGSGAGIDAFLAAREVGPKGKVIGVDMTPAMLERARANASKAGCANVEFRLGEIEHLPVADATVDVIISNCVINLSPEKERVFREAFRVLRPGGRMLVSDLVWLTAPSEAVRGSVEALVGCVAGASLKEDYLELMRRAGFQQVEVVAQSNYGSDALRNCCGENLDLVVAADAVASVKVCAIKPRGKA